MTILPHDAFRLHSQSNLCTYNFLPALLGPRLTGLPPRLLLPSMVALTQTIVLPSELHRTHRHPAADSRSAALRWQASIGACASNARRAARKIQLVASFSIPTTRPQARAAAGRSAAASGKVAVVLVDHGSRRTEANAMLETFADLYRCSYTCWVLRPTAHWHACMVQLGQTQPAELAHSIGPPTGRRHSAAS